MADAGTSPTTAVAVFGAGTMGSCMAFALARFGFRVALVDRNATSLDTAAAVIASAADLFVQEGMMSADAAAAAIDRIAVTTDGQQAAASADLVLECIIENADAKRALFAQLDQWCPERTVLASNTSYLNVFELVPERLATTVIAHWFAPPHVIPLVEVVRGEHTSQDTVDVVVGVLKTAERVPVVMDKFIDGFCINRLQRILGREIFHLLDGGYISPEMLDMAVKASIAPRAMVVGLVQRYDFTGLDLSYNNLQNADYEEPPVDNEPGPWLSECGDGHLGVKSGQGFFDYTDRPMVDVLRERDARLLHVFASVQNMIGTRV